MRIRYLVLLTGLLLGCGVKTTTKVNVDPQDLKYFKDHRTNLCFAIVASAPILSAGATGLGMTNVPCENLNLTNLERR